MLTEKELNIIETSLKKGCDVVVKAKRDEIIIIENKPKIIGRVEKSEKNRLIYISITKAIPDIIALQPRRQIVQKFCRKATACQEIYVRYDRKYTS